MPTQLDITAIVLSFNEAIHIERCIARILPHVRRVVVVDSYSTDDTAARARAMGAEVIFNEFVNQSQQFNWALDTLAIDTAWTLRLDSDEYLDDAALDWLQAQILALPDETAGIEFRLKVIFKGKHLRHGGYYSTDLLRLWRSGRGRVEHRWMDERTVVDGHTLKAPGHLVDENLNSIGWWTDKHNRYASRHVIDFILLQHSPEHRRMSSGEQLGDRARFKRFLRNRVYARFPLFVRPVLYWGYRYFVLLGFIDGKRGLIWHFLHGFWYYMLIDVKAWEAKRIIARGGLPALAERYRRSHGLSIDLPSDGRSVTSPRQERLVPASPAARIPPPSAMDVTVIIIAFNEALHINRCVQMIREHVARVVVIDSFSTDGTQDMALAAGAEIIEHAFVNHAEQFNWGMSAANVTTGWILRLDADEYVDDAGLREIREAIGSADTATSAFAIRRGVVFAGSRIRFGGINNIFLTRLWRTGTAKVEARWMDEQVLVYAGETRQLAGGAIIDENINDIDWWTTKHNGYTTRQMVQWMLEELDRASAIDPTQLNPHVRRKRMMRRRLYAPTPLFLRPMAYFVYRYIISLGFLDGRAGFLFHFFQGLWNFFLVDVKIFEARQVIAAGGQAAFKEWLSRTYAIEVSEL